MFTKIKFWGAVLSNAKQNILSNCTLEVGSLPYFPPLPEKTKSFPIEPLTVLNLYLPFNLTFKPKCCKNSKWIQWMDAGRRRKAMRFSTVEVLMPHLKACPLSTISSKWVPSLSKLTAYVVWVFPPKPMWKWNWNADKAAWGVQNHGSINDIILEVV